MKVGILTYHYSNNYGGVLQSYALYKFLVDRKINVEIINFVPSNYNNSSIFFQTGLRKNVFKISKEDLKLTKLFTRIYIKKKYSKQIIKKFDSFRENYMNLSKRVNELELINLINEYDLIIVGSDQVWTPAQRNKKEYFLGYDTYKGKRVSYAADSTISDVEPNVFDKLKNELKKFDLISVRNHHSLDFVRKIIGKDVPIVVDPTLLIDFSTLTNIPLQESSKIDENYILVYVLGKEIEGSNLRAINKIKKKYGNMKVYAIIIPTMKFNPCNYADYVFYNLSPLEWLNLFKNASFIFTDSYHGTLFSIKFRKPFLAYYVEKFRATRFQDISKRYDIDQFIVSNIDEIDKKNSLYVTPNYDKIEMLINKHKKESIKYLNKVLKICKGN